MGLEHWNGKLQEKNISKQNPSSYWNKTTLNINRKFKGNQLGFELPQDLNERELEYGKLGSLWRNDDYAQQIHNRLKKKTVNKSSVNTKMKADMRAAG